MSEESNFADRLTALSTAFEVCRPIFLAMGDETRQHTIVTLLKNDGGMRVGELTKSTNLSRPAVSHHLKILKDAGIVNMYKVGTMNFYHVDGDESQWANISDLVNHIHALVKEVSMRKRAGGDICGHGKSLSQ